MIDSTMLYVAAGCVALIGAAWILRGAVSSGVQNATMAVERERDADEKKRLADIEALNARMKLNPWHASGFNLTKQMDMVRRDFDLALKTAAEAGVDISTLRSAATYCPQSAFIPSQADEPTPKKSKPRRLPKNCNVDPSYFGVTKAGKPKRGVKVADRSTKAVHRV